MEKFMDALVKTEEGQLFLRGLNWFNKKGIKLPYNEYRQMVGRFKKAIKAQQRAITLLRDKGMKEVLGEVKLQGRAFIVLHNEKGEKKLLAEFKEHLKAYKAHKPWRGKAKEITH